MERFYHMYELKFKKEVERNERAPKKKKKHQKTKYTVRGWFHNCNLTVIVFVFFSCRKAFALLSKANKTHYCRDVIHVRISYGTTGFKCFKPNFCTVTKKG